MRADYLRIAPDLDIIVTWSFRMSEALHKCYRTVMFEQSEGNELLRKSYDRWLRAHSAAFDQIHRYFTLTGNLPVEGDCLSMSYRDGGEVLRIEQRIIFSTPDSATILLAYEVCSNEIEELEKYEEDNSIEGAE